MEAAAALANEAELPPDDPARPRRRVRGLWGATGFRPAGGPDSLRIPPAVPATGGGVPPSVPVAGEGDALLHGALGISGAQPARAGDAGGAVGAAAGTSDRDKAEGGGVGGAAGPGMADLARLLHVGAPLWCCAHRMR